jgi:hypothetical protein
MNKGADGRLRLGRTSKQDGMIRAALAKPRPSWGRRPEMALILNVGDCRKSGGALRAMV